jgi:hypothetical protein
MLLEIFILELNEQLIGYIYHLIDLDMLLDVLQMLKNHCKIVVDNDLLAGHYYGYCKEIYELQVVVG